MNTSIEYNSVFALLFYGIYFILILWSNVYTDDW
jgi:hypothetical protein